MDKLLVAAALLLPCVLSSPVPSHDAQLNKLQSSLEKAVQAEADADQYDDYIRIGEQMTPDEYEDAVMKLQQSSTGSAYNGGTMTSVRQDCENCISAQRGSITAHSVRASDATLHFPDSSDHARVASVPASPFG